MEDLRCQGCGRYYSEDERPPLTFPSCRHVSCKACLVQRLQAALQKDSRQVQCPQCPQIVYCASDPENIETELPRDLETISNLRADQVERQCIHPVPERQWACLDPQCEVKTMFCGMCSRAFHHECQRDLVLTSEEATRRLHAPRPNLPGYLPFSNLHREIKIGLQALEEQLTSLANACDRFVRAERDAIVEAARTPSGILTHKQLFRFEVDKETGALYPIPKAQDALRAFAVQTVSFFSTEFWRQASDLQTSLLVSNFPAFRASSSSNLKDYGGVLQHFEGANLRFASELVLSGIKVPAPFSFPKFLQEAETRLTRTGEIFRLDPRDGMSPEEATQLSGMVANALQTSPLTFDGVYDSLKAKLEDYAFKTGLKSASTDEFWDLKMAVGESGDGDPPASKMATFRRGDYLICFGQRNASKD